MLAKHRKQERRRQEDCRRRHGRAHIPFPASGSCGSYSRTHIFSNWLYFPECLLPVGHRGTPESLLQSRGDQEPTFSRQGPHKEFKTGAGSEPVLKVRRRHRELVEVGEEGRVVLAIFHATSLRCSKVL